jgi:hypothetical protein
MKKYYLHLIKYSKHIKFNYTSLMHDNGGEEHPKDYRKIFSDMINYI